MRYILIITMLLFSTLAHAQLEGKYLNTFNFSSTKWLTFKNDGSFSYVNQTCTNRATGHGTYIMKDSTIQLITFVPDSQRILITAINTTDHHDSIRFEVDTNDLRVGTTIYINDSIAFHKQSSKQTQIGYIKMAFAMGSIKKVRIKYDTDKEGQQVAETLVKETDNLIITRCNYGDLMKSVLEYSQYTIKGKYISREGSYDGEYQLFEEKNNN